MQTSRQRQVDRIHDLLTDDSVDHGPPVSPPPGPDGYITILTFVTTVLQIRYEVHDVICDGDMVAIRASAHGVNAVSPEGIEPTGQPFAMKTAHTTGPATVDCARTDTTSDLGRDEAEQQVRAHRLDSVEPPALRMSDGQHAHVIDGGDGPAQQNWRHIGKDPVDRTGPQKRTGQRRATLQQHIGAIRQRLDHLVRITGADHHRA